MKGTIECCLVAHSRSESIILRSYTSLQLTPYSATVPLHVMAERDLNLKVAEEASRTEV